MFPAYAGVILRFVPVSYTHLDVYKRQVRDIRSLLLGNEADEQEPEVNVLYLWDNLKGFVANAVSYGKELDEDQEYALTEGYGELVVK